MSEGFDKTVHFRDGKSGKVIRKSPYRLHVAKQGNDAVKIFERDGVKYYENGELVEQPKKVAEATLDAVVAKIETTPTVSKETVAAVIAKSAAQKTG